MSRSEKDYRSIWNSALGREFPVLWAFQKMVNTAQRGRCDLGMIDVAHVRREPLCLIKAFIDASTTPSETEQLKDQLDSLADEIGKANWKDGAALKPRSGYSYDVVER
jgi:hypothetical protein